MQRLTLAKVKRHSRCLVVYLLDVGDVLDGRDGAHGDLLPPVVVGLGQRHVDSLGTRAVKRLQRGQQQQAGSAALAVRKHTTSLLVSLTASLLSLPRPKVK